MRATCPYSRSWRSRTMLVTGLDSVLWSNRCFDTKSFHIILRRHLVPKTLRCLSKSLLSLYVYCQTAVRTASNQWIIASPPAFSISAMTLQTPAVFSPFNLFTASLTSAREGGVSSTGRSAAAISTPANDSRLLGGSATYKCPSIRPNATEPHPHPTQLAHLLFG